MVRFFLRSPALATFSHVSSGNRLVSAEQMLELGASAQRGRKSFSVSNDLRIDAHEFLADHLFELVEREREVIVAENAVLGAWLRTNDRTHSLESAGERHRVQA